MLKLNNMPLTQGNLFVRDSFLYLLGAALIGLITIRMNQMPVHKVEEITFSDEPAETQRPKLQIYGAFQCLPADCFDLVCSQIWQQRAAGFS